MMRVNDYVSFRTELNLYWKIQTKFTGLIKSNQELEPRLVFNRIIMLIALLPCTYTPVALQRVGYWRLNQD